MLTTRLNTIGFFFVCGFLSKPRQFKVENIEKWISLRKKNLFGKHRDSIKKILAISEKKSSVYYSVFHSIEKTKEKVTSEPRKSWNLNEPSHFGELNNSWGEKCSSSKRFGKHLIISYYLDCLEFRTFSLNNLFDFFYYSTRQ